MNFRRLFLSVTLIICFGILSLSAATMKVVNADEGTDSNIIYVTQGETFALEVRVTDNSDDVNAAAVFLDYAGADITLESYTPDIGTLDDTFQQLITDTYANYNVIGDSTSSNFSIIRIEFTANAIDTFNVDFYTTDDANNRQSALVDYTSGLNVASFEGCTVVVDTTGTPAPSGDTTLVITEVNYDQSTGDDEWFEVYNYGSDTVDLQNWKIIEVTSSAYTYKNISGGVVANINGDGLWSIGPGQYAVVASDGFDWTVNGYSDTPDILFDAVALTFSTTGEDIGLLYTGDDATAGTSDDDTVSLFTIPDIADKGHTIELVDVSADITNASNWQKSDELGDSTPGYANTIRTYGADTFIVINEIMYDVPGGFSETYDEWIEIYNRGDDTVSVENWTFGQLGGDKTLNTVYSGDFLIGPGEYAVVMENAERWVSDGYGDTPATLIDLSAGITLDPAGDTIALYNSAGDTIETFYYEDLGVDMSIERIDPNSADYTSSNWEASDQTGGETHTAGLVNTTGAAPAGEAVIAITSHTDGDTSAVVDIVISGTTLNSSTGDTVYFYKDGVEQSLINLASDDGNFEDTISLSAETNVISVKLVYNNGDSEVWDTVTVYGEFTPTYGLRDDGGVNLPSITYWYTDAGSDQTDTGSTFDGTDLGSIDALYLKGATIKSWKDEGSGGNVTGAVFSYKIWKDGEAEPGTYDTQSVEWTSDDGLGNQTWADGETPFTTFDEIAVHESATSVGTWNVKIMFSVLGSGIPGTVEDGPWTLTFDSGAVSGESVTISGTVTAEAGDDSGITVWILEYPGNAVIAYDTTTTDGAFAVQIDSGYTGYVRAKEAHHLAVNTADTYIFSVSTDVGNLGELKAGDANDDNKINIFDASIVKSGVQSTKADIDRTGAQGDATDLGYVRINFGEIGEEEK